MNYRKFSHYYTQFAYAGQPKPNQDPKLLIGQFQQHGVQLRSAQHSGRMFRARSRDRIPGSADRDAGAAKASVPLGPVRTGRRWCAKKTASAGTIGASDCCLQGDLKGAEYAFKKVTEAEPGYADGWLNVARALIQEGETDAAKPYVEQALKINSKLGRIYFFKAMIEKADGDYDGALDSLDTALGMYPRDRVVLNQMARILFLEAPICRSLEVSGSRMRRGPGGSADALHPHAVSPRLGRRGGRAGASRRFSSGSKRRNRRRRSPPSRACSSPENNNERQPIHDHESVPLNLQR